MHPAQFTDNEQLLVKLLPEPPPVARIRTTNVWIIEWLAPNEQLTGRALHEWIQRKRPAWSAYFPCQTKANVLEAVRRAAIRAQQSGMVPILHFEAHGCDKGLAPDGDGSDFLSWEELADPLQELNLATRCNLVVVVAACFGFAGIHTFHRGPRAPAVALVGPDREASPSQLLWGMKEFYRRWMDENPRLSEIVGSASRDAAPVVFEVEPFVTLCYEAFVEFLIASIRPVGDRKCEDRICRRMFGEIGLSAREIGKRLDMLSSQSGWGQLQEVWDTMFMIDLYPDNQKRFGLDMREIAKAITNAQ